MSKYSKQLAALETLMVFLERAAEPSYSSRSIASAASEVQHMISTIESKRALDQERVHQLIAPTGTLQEIAVDNGWSDIFLMIAAELER